MESTHTEPQWASSLRTSLRLLAQSLRIKINRLIPWRFGSEERKVELTRTVGLDKLLAIEGYNLTL